MPHYIVKLLNTIQSMGVEVVAIVPKCNGASIGNGVHETFEGAQFKTIFLEQYKAWYGKPFFKGFFQVLKEENITTLVLGWPYFLALVFNPLLLRKIKQINCQIYAREIPFTVPLYNDTLQAFSDRCVEAQKTEKLFKSPFLFKAHQWVRKHLYTHVVDHALVYTEQGVDILSSYGLAKNKITVTYNSPDTDSIFASIASLKAKGELPVKQPHKLLHVGRLVAWKKVDELIRVVVSLRNTIPDIELDIVGDGPEYNNLQALVNDLACSDYVHFKGAIYEGEALSKCFLASGIYVLAGMGGLSINEAMAHSLPIICSVADGTEKHLVYEGLNGVYFKDGNQASLSQAIQSMCQGDTDSMGKASLKIIQDKINLQQVAKHFVSAFYLKN
jgi:glycosyltransferase involved in cell wall biosynthesis